MPIADGGSSSSCPVHDPPMMMNWKWIGNKVWVWVWVGLGYLPQVSVCELYLDAFVYWCLGGSVLFWYPGGRAVSAFF